jgi:signal transduction histidine kinase
MEVDLDRSSTKMLPLLSGEEAVGAIVFELHYPADKEQLEEKLRLSAHLAGVVLGMALGRRTQQRYAERFVQILAEPTEKESPALEERSADKIAEKLSAEQSLLAVAEMAAGAAHELNNPLSVVSGRAQLLSDAEDDPQKKRMLKQIQDNAKELSNIIDDLMGFAQPEPPRFAETDIRQMLDEAVQLTVQKTKLEEPDIQFEVAEDSGDVLVDSAQVASAIANILSNSLESYGKDSGPVKVTARADESGDFVKFQISDSGCGMDEETLKKATQPFFCSKPAGRKRGMGLAHAVRLIQLNKGSLDIESQAGEGTTVTILLPTK